MWEHPTLARSLRKVFHQEKTPLPRRSLTDSLLQAANERAYMEEFGKTGSQGGEIVVPLRARQTWAGITANFGAARNFQNFSLSNMTSHAPFLMRPKTFAYKEAIKTSLFHPYPRYKVYYDSFPSMPLNKGLVSEVGLYNFDPSEESWIDWNSWIYDDWYQVCQTHPTLCLGLDGRNHVRVRYRAYISPDPLEHAYFKQDSGATFGEIHSTQSSGAGIIGHQLVVQADVQTTEAGFFTPQALAPGFRESIPMAVFGMNITNLTTNQSVTKEFSVLYGDAIGGLEHTFTASGLYQVFIYLKSIEVAGITVSTPLSGQISRRGGIVNHASHPLRFLVFVSSPPNSPESQDVAADGNAGSSPSSTTQSQEIELVDGETESPNMTYLWAVGVLVGALLLVKRGDS